MRLPMRKYLLIFLVSLLPALLVAQELLDPRTRDESINQTVVSVEVTEGLGNGYTEYVYTIQSQSTNKGTIDSFKIAVGCDIDYGEITLPASDNLEVLMDMIPQSGHFPVSVLSGQNTSGLAVDLSQSAAWRLDLNPGQSATAILLSSAPRGATNFTLTPYMTTDGWDYATYEGDPLARWIPDFTVTGSIEGPECLQPNGGGSSSSSSSGGGSSSGKQQVQDISPW